MDPALKVIIRIAAALGAAQGLITNYLGLLSVPGRWISGIFAVVALAGLVGEIIVDTAATAPATPPK